jgi:Gas vesicle synthesis protein GvpL/GvpF
VSRVSLAEFGEEELRENLNDVKWLEEKARAHERALEEILARTTVVPMRLCTIYRSDQQVREMLGRERDIFAEALGRLEGRTEWAVKLIAAPGALARAAAAIESDGHDESALAPGAAYMRDRRLEARTREEIDVIAEDWAGAVHERLASRASEALVNPLQNPEVSGHTGDMLLNGVYLVDDTGVDAFRDVVDGLEREYRALGTSVELSGPWPPYNFVKGSIEAAR